MKHKQTLRSRIIFSYCKYLGILLLIYSFAIYGLIHFSQDMAFEKQLIETSEQVMMSIQRTGQIPSDLPPHFKVFTELSDIPAKLQAHLSGRLPGYFEIDTEGMDFHVAICKSSSTDKKIYVLYDVGSFEFSKTFERTFGLSLLGVGFFICLIGGVLARSVANQIMTPITTLAKTVDTHSPDGQFNILSNLYQADDEVGLLVSTINELINRTDEFVQREREFTLFASHELRTPLSVIKGAVEIIQESMEGKDKRKLLAPLERIDLSIKELDVLINTFLLLARYGHIQDPETPCEIKDVIEEVVATYRYLLEGKSVEIILDTNDAGSITAPSSVVAIAIGNLIRNAFQYTMSGKVAVIAQDKHIKVCDTGLGLEGSKTSKGTGLGLLIIRRLCERTGWQHSISKLPEGGTQADLFFN